MPHQLAIIGAGVMAEAIARGILSAGSFKAADLIAADPAAARREFFQSQLKIAAVETAAAAATDARIILLCVKPYQMESVLREIAPHAHRSALFVSIAAGIGAQFIAAVLGPGHPWRIIRAMPNTPILAGAGMVAIAPGNHATQDDIATARGIFESAAKVIQVAEGKMDAVTAVSGSGPAYFYFLTEQLVQAGIDLGLTPEEAQILATQTAVGAAKIMDESNEPPSEHRRRVTTPNGTTHAAISHMESQNWPATTREAIKAASRRSKELGK